jgi:serine/threonine-protein kinase HipA
MNKRCLYCYEPLEKEIDFHERCSMKFFGTKTVPELEYSLGEMAELAKNVVERSVAVPGVQPKLSLTMISSATNAGKRLTVVGALGGFYTLKPPSVHYRTMPENEHITMRIAEAFGISTVPSSLIRLKSGELSYISRRIDRLPDGTKIHMIDMFQITEAFDKYRSSMERIGKAIEQYSTNTLLDQVSFFELAVFCFLTGNNDMHLKNFSMIQDGDEWKLSPAYDLLSVMIVNPKDDEELALTLEGKKKKLRRGNFIRLGKGLGLNDKQIQGVFKRMEENKENAFEWIDKSFLSHEMKEEYKKLLDERYGVFRAQ